MQTTLFMTRNMSLAQWRDTGTLLRETALYTALREEKGVRVRFVSWGTGEDGRIAKTLGFDGVCTNRYRLPRRRYEQLLPFLHWNAFRQTDIIKTNQMLGAEIALKASKIWNKAFIARCGYMWSKNATAEKGRESQWARNAFETERLAFSGADRIIVTTAEMATDVEQRFPQIADRISVIPNYVETDRFRPLADRPSSTPPVLGFVGRLAPEKNLLNLIDAVRGLDVRLELVGTGPMEDQLRRKAKEQGNVHLHGMIPNTDLPSFLQRCDMFVFPSLYEGHPKSLIEAMSSGLPIVTTNVSGIRELIQHQRTGWLTESDAPSLRRAIRHVLDTPGLGAEMGHNARHYVLEHFALGKITQMEYETYQRTLKEKGKRPRN